ncbi:hypothetical protein TKK_0016361 [Trichogramma kaykai]
MSSSSAARSTASLVDGLKLSPELVNVWTGWIALGDREIVREASAKGLHIELAHKFLEKRRNCTPQEARMYFNKEVEIWVNGLLKKGQIHRASHVLKNVGKVPADYIKTTCMNSKDSGLRNFLAKHVESLFTIEEKEAWNMIHLIAEHESDLKLSDNLLSQENLEKILKLPQKMKDALYTELYFYCYKPEIVAYLKDNVVWDYLLANNKLDLLKFWIDLYYSSDKSLDLSSNLERSDIQLLLSTLKITNEMISSIESSNAMPLVKNEIFNYLSSYGIFSPSECKNAKLILSRLFGECYTLSEIPSILLKTTCNVEKNDFFSKIDTIRISRDYADTGNISEINVKNKALFDSMKKMCTHLTTDDIKDLVETGISETINYLSDCATTYLMENPVIAFTLIFLHYSRCKQSTSLREIFNDRNDSGIQLKTINISKNVLDSVISQLSYLKYETETKAAKSSITMYQLLDGCEKFQSPIFFKWRFKQAKMLDFSNEKLAKKYGHKEQLNYIYYLKEGRPNMAINMLKQDRLTTGGSLSSTLKSQVTLHAHVFALRNVKNVAIVSGCLAFIEMLGMNSENLKLHVAAANLVQRELNVCIGTNLEAMIYNSQQDLKLVMNYVERSFHSKLTISLLDNNDSFVEALKNWDVIVRLARIQNASLPTSMLKFLAANDAWFEFALLGEIFAYPVSQMVECIQHFDSTSLREHLLLSLKNPQLLEDATVCKDILSDHNDDLWLMILKCHESPNPPEALRQAARLLKSPILIVLATCYEPTSIASYFCTWIVISTDNLELTEIYEGCMENQVWTARDVASLYRDVISRGYVSTLLRGWQIFLPENPLKMFVQYLTQCIDYCDFEDRQGFLENFIGVCLELENNAMMDWECDEATYWQNVYWIHSVAINCIIVSLDDSLDSTYSRLQLLTTLKNENFHSKLSVDAPNFDLLLEYTKILAETGVSLNYSSFDTTLKTNDPVVEIERCINELLLLQHYQCALKLAQTANVNASSIILAQCREEFQRHSKQGGVVTSDFWQRCFDNFEKYYVCHEKAAEFFVEHAEKVKSYKSRYEILKLASEILEKSSQDRRVCDTVEMAMWKSCILAGPENIDIESREQVFSKLKTELMSSLSGLQVNCSLVDEAEKLAVETLIGRMLDAGRLDTALRIGAIFSHRNKDVQILMLCLSLAEGELSPYQLFAHQRALLCDTKRPKQRSVTLKSLGLQRLPSSNSLNLSIESGTPPSTITASTIDVLKQEKLDCLSLLTNSVETLNHGADIGMRVLLCYHLALHLGKNYEVLLTHNDPMHLLQEVVAGTHEWKLEIARDIITAYQIENQKVAHFLADEIVAHITQIIEDGQNEPTAAWNYNMNLQSVIELCKDTSLLGSKLLDMARKLLGHSHGEKRNLVTLKIIVELLIRSHDCFTASCNMEGIASVLKKCQQLANSLQNLKHWSLLVRLVTGVGRFTEMNYIFQILKEHDQFEFLLGRGLDKIPGLRMAMLDFLKRHCPENKDLFNIVALHFRLYYEIALMWESEAKDVINELVNEAKKECGRVVYSSNVELNFTRNESTEKRLQLVVANLTHATQYFLQDNKLNLANRCSHQAQLVALQISLCSRASVNATFPCLLNLQAEEINRAISRHLSFSQALIVARAYEHHVDWASAIYHHCLINGESKYLRDFITSKCLTASVAVDCARRYRLEKTISKLMSENMQVLVAKVNDNECKYVLASQLGFRKIVEDMLDDPAVGAYLKDTVFRRRYMGNEML